MTIKPVTIKHADIRFRDDSLRSATAYGIIIKKVNEKEDFNVPGKIILMLKHEARLLGKANAFRHRIDVFSRLEKCR